MKRNFRFFVASSALSLLGIEVFHITLPLLGFSLHLNPIQISWCIFSFYCPVIFIKIASSTVIEKKNKIKTLKLSEVGRIICTVLFVYCLYIFHNTSLSWLLPISFFYGIFTVFTEVAEPVVIKNLIHGQKSTVLLSTYEVRTRTVQLLAPALCGYLISVNLFSPYLLILLFSLIALSLLFFMNTSETMLLTSTKSGIAEDIGHAVTWLSQNRFFLMVILLTAINNFLHPVLYLTVIWDLKEQNTAFEITGLVLSGLGAGGLIGSILARKIMDILTFRSLLLVVNILRVMVFSGFLLSTNPVWIFILFVFKAILGGLWNVGYNVFTIQEMPIELAARISAISGTFVKLSAGLGSLVAGYFLIIAGATATLAILVILTFFMLACTFIYKNEKQSQQRFPD